MSTSDIISIIATAIAAGALTVNVLQYRASRNTSRTETSRRDEQHQRLIDLKMNAESIAETARIIANSAAHDSTIDAEGLQELSKLSGRLASELSTEAEYSRPTPDRGRHKFKRK